jgi:hypothetical protein
MLCGAINWLHTDLTARVPRQASYDLVSAQFMHLPKDPGEALFHRLAASVVPAGTLLIVDLHPSDTQTTVPRPPVPELFFTACDIATALYPHEWATIVNEVRARPTLDAEGRTLTIHDAVLRAHRRR